ncbi:hypothetical protein P280DRAFT_477695 [Massarina eburnea CBS 473.64]|uniref:Uncharacterized protein n=1 Tax=Massarina eburnea CBS 473.64 TaxID=1395130 RepID=A0A6A6SD28_9PLEO|nr:hypothetical protein P280DRAFT_477695 [Massarina eburnea CBS 473.64]
MNQLRKARKQSGGRGHDERNCLDPSLRKLQINDRDSKSILFFRTITPPYIYSSAVAIVEDEDGDVAELAVGDFDEYPVDPIPLEGSFIAVKQEGDMIFIKRSFRKALELYNCGLRVLCKAQNSDFISKIDFYRKRCGISIVLPRLDDVACDLANTMGEIVTAEETLALPGYSMQDHGSECLIYSLANGSMAPRPVAWSKELVQKVRRNKSLRNEVFECKDGGY